MEPTLFIGNFAFRAFDPAEDLPLLVALLRAVEETDQDAEDTSEETQRMYMGLPNHNPPEDRWVVEVKGDPINLVGFASTWRRNVWSPAIERAESYIAVYPGFRDLWGHYGPRPGDEHKPAWLERVDHENIFMVFGPDGEAAGYCLALEKGLEQQESIPEGYIEEPGILPKHRDKGLVRPLVLAALGWLQARGLTANTLDSWGEDEQTIAIYRTMGFEVIRHLVSYLRYLGSDQE
jgi:ribosomal protein S18 acetylase RimI-like enzyme